MSDALQAVATALLNALELAKQLEEDCIEIIKMLIQIQKQADEASKIEFPAQMGLSWKQEMSWLSECAVKTQTSLKVIIDSRTAYSKHSETVARKNKEDITDDDYQQIYNHLLDINDMAPKFGKELSVLIKAIKDAKTAANKLMNELEKKQRQHEDEKFWQKFKGGAAAVVLTAFAAGMVYCTGGAAAPLAAKVVAGAAGALAIGSAVYGFSCGDLNKKIEEFERLAAGMKMHLDAKKSEIGNFQLQEAIKKVIVDVVYEIKRRNEEKAMQEQLKKKDEEMEQMRREMAELKAKQEKQ